LADKTKFNSSCWSSFCLSITRLKKLAWAEYFGIIWDGSSGRFGFFLKKRNTGYKNKIIHAAIWDESDIDLER
jgi:hypothetical protein